METDDAFSTLKNIDVTSSNTGLFVFNSTTGVIQLLNGVTQGVTASSRLGRKIYLKGLQLTGTISKAPTQTGETVLRIMIVFDNQTNGATPAITDVLTANNIDGLRNLSNADRFVIIYDELCPFGSVFNTAKKVNDEIDLFVATTFNSNNFGDVRDIQTGGVFLITFNNAGLQTASPLGNIVTRIMYEDD